jgi:hypothetical protein
MKYAVEMGSGAMIYIPSFIDSELLGFWTLSIVWYSKN